MFEGANDAELLAAMGDAQQAERAAFARQLLAVGEFTHRRMEAVYAEHDFWCVDDWEAIVAEIGAELGISRGRASSQMGYGRALIERFPKLAEVFAAGAVDFRVIAAAIFRTDLVHDTDALAVIDAQLAAKAPAWNKLSREKITELVDWLVIEADPDAVRVAKQRDIDRHLEVGPGQHGMAEIWGEVRGPDAAVFDAKLNELAATVCPDDPRTTTQRRADALTPLAAGATHMACEDGDRRVKERTQKLWADRPLPKHFNYMLNADPRVAVAMVLAFLGRYPDDKPFVIIDTLGRIKPQKRAGDESYLSDYQFAARLKAAIDTRPGAALLAIHHTRKAETEDFVEAGSGTLGLAGAFDTVLVLRRKRHEANGTLLVSGRDVEEGRYAVRVDDGRWVLAGPTLIDAAEVAHEQAAVEEVSRYSDRTQSVIKIVRERAAKGDVTTPNDIVQQTGIPQRQVATTLKRLCDAGLIEKPAYGAYSTPGSGSGVSGVPGVVAGQPHLSPHHSNNECCSGPQSNTPNTPVVNGVVYSETNPEHELHRLHQLHHNPVHKPIVEGPDRCTACGWHGPTQGHAANCPLHHLQSGGENGDSAA